MSPGRLTKEERRLKIVEAAAHVFAEKGFQAATMDQVSRAAGVAKGTTYLYFKSKLDLFVGVYEWFTQLLGTSSGKLLQDGPAHPAEQLKVLFRGFSRLAVEYDDFFPLVMEFWSSCSQEERATYFRRATMDSYRQLRLQVEAILRQGQAQGYFRPEVDPVGTAAMLVGAIDGLTLQNWIDRDFDGESIGAAFIETLIDGLGTGPNSAPANGEEK